MNDCKLAYLAGFFDGEGCIQIHKQKPKKYHPYGQITLQVRVVNTSLANLKLFTEWGGTIHQRVNPYPFRYKDAFVWEINGRYASEFLKLILPYLFQKREQAEIAIRFIKLLLSPKQYPKGISNENREQREVLLKQIQELHVTK